MDLHVCGRDCSHRIIILLRLENAKKINWLSILGSDICARDFVVHFRTRRAHIAKVDKIS